MARPDARLAGCPRPCRHRPQHRRSRRRTLTGLRMSVTISWLVLVVSEQINASGGIGYLMTQARTFGRTDVVLVGLVVYGLLGLFSDTLVRLLERRALAWRRTPA
ncbi:ABC transporter permease subunit [Kitasatospora sp. NPDC048239]|uniref:ABC transporter permease subunit n=1 Tax=Kitasatospora sp. NPDC048239 TaxID=3364046 RepID=UPI003719C6EB